MIIKAHEVVKVKLTKTGLAVLRKELGDPPRESDRQLRPFPWPDSGGYSEFHLDTLMKLFGPHFIVGDQMPFEEDIIIEEGWMKKPEEREMIVSCETIEF